MGDRICSVDYCDNPARARSLCTGHYQQQAKGHPFSPVQPREFTIEARFARYVIKAPSGCWIWVGALSTGYGVVTYADRRWKYAHRVSLERAGVEIPEGYHVDHLCRVPRCVNPMHLQPVPIRVNVTERAPNSVSGINARKTHCVRGHEFTPENTNVTPQGHRRCRTCRREDKRAEREAARA